MRTLIERLRVALRDWLNKPTAQEIADAETDRAELARFRDEIRWGRPDAER